MQRLVDEVPDGRSPFEGREPLLSRLHAYWESKRAGRLMPARRDIDMVEIDRAVLPHIILHDIVRVPGARTRYRYRLIGTELVAMVGNDITNRFVDEVLSAEGGRHLADWLDAAVAAKKPLTLEMPVAVPDKGFRSGRRIVLPLSECGREANMLLCAMVLR
jgi:hypothetical protein